MWYVDIDNEKIMVNDLDEIEEYCERNNLSSWDVDIWVSRDGISYIDYCDIW